MSNERPSVEPGPVLHWKIGDVTVTRVGELIVDVPREYLLPDITDQQLADDASWLAPYFTNGLMRLSIHTFVVRSQGRTIVVDTCVGDDPIRTIPGDPSFPDRVAAEIPGGLAAVDMVLCTHLHFDHLGWNTRVINGQRVATFPNARYLFGRTELAYLESHDPHEVASDDVAPLLSAGLVDLIESDHSLTSEVRCVPTHGHTPGHVSVLIESHGQCALITGDATHSPIQFRYPEIAATGFDWDSTRSSATRRQMVADYADTDVLILGTHFAPPTAGHVRTDDRGAWFDS